MDLPLYSISNSAYQLNNSAVRIKTEGKMETVTQTQFQKDVLAMQENKSVITLVSEETYYHFLEAVPPVYFNGGFACGEAYSHNSLGVPVYYCFTSRDGKEYGILSTIGEAKLKFAQSENFNF